MNLTLGSLPSNSIAHILPQCQRVTIHGSDQWSIGLTENKNEFLTLVGKIENQRFKGFFRFFFLNSPLHQAEFHPFFNDQERNAEGMNIHTHFSVRGRFDFKIIDRSSYAVLNVEAIYTRFRLNINFYAPKNCQLDCLVINALQTHLQLQGGIQSHQPPAAPCPVSADNDDSPMDVVFSALEAATAAAATPAETYFTLRNSDLWTVDFFNNLMLRLENDGPVRVSFSSVFGPVEMTIKQGDLKRVDREVKGVMCPELQTARPLRPYRATNETFEMTLNETLSFTNPGAVEHKFSGTFLFDCTSKLVYLRGNIFFEDQTREWNTFADFRDETKKWNTFATDDKCDPFLFDYPQENHSFYKLPPLRYVCRGILTDSSGKKNQGRFGLNCKERKIEYASYDTAQRAWGPYSPYLE